MYSGLFIQEKEGNAMSLKGQTIAAGGVKLNVVVEGKGPDVMLLHGFPDSASLWRNQIPVLEDAGYRVIVPDLRGFGESDAPVGKKNYTIDTIVKDVESVMDQTGTKKCWLVGHDWGAIIGWAFATSHPDRVERYVAISVGHPRAYSKAGIEQKLRAWYAVSFQFTGIAERVTRAHDWFIMRRLTNNHPECKRWIEDMSRPGRLTAGMNWYRANLVRMLAGDFPNVKVPVLGIWSTGDIYLTERQMKDSAAYVDATWRYERIEGSSHWIPLDVPQRLNELLLDYLKV